MGFLNRIMGFDAAQKQWRNGPQEQFARILAIQKVIGPLTELRLEVHFSNSPPHVVSTMVRVPRGVTPEVGQDVAFHLSGSGDGGSVHYVVDWDKPPEYGGPIYDAQAAGEKVIEQVMGSGRQTTPEQAADPDHQLKALTERHAAGQITDAELAHAKEDLERFAQDPAHENDPEVHRARLEQRRAAGEVSDAEYEQRTRDLDAWAANLKRLR